MRVERAPSHADERAHLLASQRAWFVALGNVVADAWAGLAAEAWWREGVFGEEPRSDDVDAIAALVHCRARKALERASARDAEMGSRLVVPRRLVRTPARVAMQKSAREMVKGGSRWPWRRCDRLVQSR